MTLSEAKWAELVDRWRASRQSARVFATSHGVTDSALRYWAGRLTREKEKRPSSTIDARPSGRATATTTAPALARVVRPGDAPVSHGRIVVVVGNVTIVVERGFDGAHLREVVRVLSEAE